MTLAELTTEVLARLNLSSPEATARVKRELNDAYRRVTSAIGLITSRRASVSQAATPGDPNLTFSLDKIERVYVTDSGRQRVLREVTYDEAKTASVTIPSTGESWVYAVERMQPGSVVILLHPTPSDATTFHADGYQILSALGDADTPLFPADFHDVLIYDVMRVEYTKLEKPELAAMAKADYEQRLSDLRFFIAKSNSQAIQQGSRSNTGFGPYWPGRRWMSLWRR